MEVQPAGEVQLEKGIIILFSFSAGQAFLL